LPRAFILITLIIMTAFPHGAQAQSDVPEEPEDKISEKVITFGCLLPLTGRYKLLGEKALKGVLAAADTGHAGARYRVIVRDIRDSDERLVASLEELLNTPGLSFIVGPVPSKYIQAVSAGVNRKRIPALVFPVSENEASGGPYIIKYYYPLEEQSRVLSGYAARSLGVRRFAVLYPRTALGSRMKELFASDVAESGGKLVYEGSYDPDLRDISGEIGWIRSLAPEAVFIPDGAANSAELILRLKREGKLRDVLFLGLSTWNSPLFLDLIGREIDGFVYRAVFTDVFYYGDGEWGAFSQLTEDRYKAKPDIFGYQVYRALKLLLALDQAPPNGGAVVPGGLESLKNNPNYDVKIDKSGSYRVSPRYRILSVSDGELIDIINVK
jgi:ABC-type branched-subunit amino acid transport system substrate-binding protein